MIANTLKLDTRQGQQVIEFTWISHWDNKDHKVIAPVIIRSPVELAESLRVMAYALLEANRTHERSATNQPSTDKPENL